MYNWQCTRWSECVVKNTITIIEDRQRCIRNAHLFARALHTGSPTRNPVMCYYHPSAAHISSCLVLVAIATFHSLFPSRLFADREFHSSASRDLPRVASPLLSCIASVARGGVVSVQPNAVSRPPKGFSVSPNGFPGSSTCWQQRALTAAKQQRTG